MRKWVERRIKKRFAAQAKVEPMSAYECTRSFGQFAAAIDKAISSMS